LFFSCIRVLRTNNALEYTQNEISHFFLILWYITLTTCLHTSQQKGVAERKLRHLLDVAHTLLIHMHVPK